MTVLVCVGGLAAGRRVDVPDNRRHIQVLEPLDTAFMHRSCSDAELAGDSFVRFEIYERQSLHWPSGQAEYLAPQGMPASEQIEELLKGYRL